VLHDAIRLPDDDPITASARSAGAGIEERIDVEALLKSIGSPQDLRFRQRGLEPAIATAPTPR
jgi:hypothetical protein